MDSSHPKRHRSARLVIAKPPVKEEGVHSINLRAYFRSKDTISDRESTQALQYIPCHLLDRQYNHRFLAITFLLITHLRCRGDTKLTRTGKLQETFLVGLGLYAWQAGHSVTRALGSDFSELRDFYQHRTRPAHLAEMAMKPRTPQQNCAPGLFNRGLQAEDMILMARLLFDFGRVLNGETPSHPDAASLAYCLGKTSDRFLRKLKVLKALDIARLNHFNRNENLPEPVEIEFLIGNSWYEQQ